MPKLEIRNLLSITICTPSIKCATVAETCQNGPHLGMRNSQALMICSLALLVEPLGRIKKTSPGDHYPWLECSTFACSARIGSGRRCVISCHFMPFHSIFEDECQNIHRRLSLILPYITWQKTDKNS